jgi:hypothetical protein
MKAAFAGRIKVERRLIHSLEDLERFIGTRANELLLTPPRNMKVTSPADDLARLYREYVGGRAMGEAVLRKGQGLSVRPRLRALFASPDLQNKVQEDVRVAPKYGRPFTADYAFSNGKESFVVPQTIHVDPDQTMREAELLAIRGIQLARHGVDGRSAELIVPLPDPAQRLGETTEEVWPRPHSRQERGAPGRQTSMRRPRWRCSCSSEASS